MKSPTAPVCLQDGDRRKCNESRNEEELGNNYAGFVQRLEAELSQVKGRDEKMARQHAGRAEGPRDAWKDASATKTCGSTTTTTSVSRAWLKTVGGPGELMRTKLVCNAGSLRWRILHYDHRQPDHASATPQQEVIMSLFSAWKKVISGGALHSAVWVDMQPYASTTQAEREVLQLKQQPSPSMWPG